MSDNFFVSDHPLVAQKLSQMRTDLSSREFTRLMREIGMFLAYEMTSDIKTKQIEIDTIRSGRVPIGTELLGIRPAIIPILRSGLVLSEGIKEMLPDVMIGHIGIHKDKRPPRELTEYFVSLPDSPDAFDRMFILADPVIATGDTACRAIEILRDNGVDEENIRFVAVITSWAGKERLIRQHHNVRVYCAHVDRGLDNKGSGLNTKGQVVPGLGSISNRLFGFYTHTAF